MARGWRLKPTDEQQAIISGLMDRLALCSEGKIDEEILQWLAQDPENGGAPDEVIRLLVIDILYAYMESRKPPVVIFSSLVMGTAKG